MRCPVEIKIYNPDIAGYHFQQRSLFLEDEQFYVKSVAIKIVYKMKDNPLGPSGVKGWYNEDYSEFSRKVFRHAWQLFHQLITSLYHIRMPFKSAAIMRTLFSPTKRPKTRLTVAMRPLKSFDLKLLY
jgi:hypothetical protein